MSPPLIKMSELVTVCGRDRLPIVWLQDTSGIDVGDAAEKAELPGLRLIKEDAAGRPLELSPLQLLEQNIALCGGS